MRPHHDKIRACLGNSPDGMSIAELGGCTQIKSDTVRRSIKTCFGVYIDRYDGPIRGQWRAVYMLADVPQDAPIPERKREKTHEQDTD